MSFKKWIALSVLTTMGLTQALSAAGFQTRLVSATSMGVADAGGAAYADDASSLFWNPAGMTRLCGSEVDVSAFVLVPSAKFHNKDSVHITGAPLSGGNGHNAGEPALAGSLFMTRQLDYGFWFGLGVNAPFGLVTDYGHDWVGRYYANRSALLTVNINPCIAYRLNDCWSFGAGFNALYTHIKLSNAVDFGFIGFLINPELGLLPQQNDGNVVLRGNAWGYGGNVGVLYEMSCNTRFGAQYRSQVYLDVDGSETFSDVPVVLAPGFPDTRLKAKARLPASASISAFHDFENCWAIMGDITWTGWHVFKALDIAFKSGQPNAVTQFRWKDSWRFAVGGVYTPNNCWVFRGGFAFDQRVNRNKVYTSPRVPENDKYIFAVGAGYRGCFAKIDLAYMYELYSPPRINTTEFTLPENNLKGGLRGHWNNHVHIVAIQGSYIF